MNYKPPKPFFKMNIEELKRYVNQCKLKDKSNILKRKKRKTRRKKLRIKMSIKNRTRKWLKS